MTSETQRIDRIVQQFFEYARPPRLAPEPVDLDALVGDVAGRARSRAEARGVRIEVAAPGAGTAVVDPAQLRQALDNLVRNAVEATPEGGAVSLAARREGGETDIRGSKKSSFPSLTFSGVTGFCSDAITCGRGPKNRCACFSRYSSALPADAMRAVQNKTTQTIVFIREEINFPVKTFALFMEDLRPCVPDAHPLARII